MIVELGEVGVTVTNLGSEDIVELEWVCRDTVAIGGEW